jgi:probable dihydroxyacetone kinase regulator
MKHEITTLNTKKTLAASLKKLMMEKPLSKITISEIIKDCGMNRKTFYYHFEDIYSLLQWMLEQEAVEVVRQFDLLVDYEDAILFVLDYVDSNKHILNCAFDSTGREKLKRFLYADFVGIMRMVIDGTEKELGLRVSEDFKMFLCNFATEALAGMLIGWIRDRTVRDREKTIHYISLILSSSLPQVLLAAQQSKQQDRP